MLTTCPYCSQPRDPNTDECGGEGEGICDVYAALIDAEASPPADIDAWLAARVSDCQLDPASVSDARGAILLALAAS